MAVANYLWGGLNRYDRAIEILLIAYREGVLDEGAQNQLAQWLHERSRFAESIPILEPLVEQHLDSMHYRTMLMIAYHRAERPQQLLDLVKNTDAHFHAGGRWTDGNVSEFGKACESCGLHEKAVGYLTEAISLHQRANGQIVLGDATLSDWYQHLANSHSALGHIKEAVDAASGAIVCWSPRQDQRRDALNNLKGVLHNVKDLPTYIKQIDAEADKTGEDSAILRKAIGQVLQERQEFKQAITQLKLAVQLQPADKEIHQALIACYNATENKSEGTRQLLKLIELESHNLALYQQLADRLKDQPAEAERAVTSIIEAGPQEAENHTALAEIRQKQGRWNEAIDQWSEAAKLRSLEPTDLVKLAEAQIHQKQWEAARKSIEKLQRAEWPSRFGDINNQTRQLQEKLPK
jgi:tetratricopeptide (TPR) repeat protein